jgi:hypothetical protein
MKRVLLDHCVPRPFGRLLAECSVVTAQEMGWSLLKNGELLAAAQTAGFEVLLTADQSLRYQQNLGGRTIAIIELPTNRLRIVIRCAESVNALLAKCGPGEFHIVSLPDDS